MVYSRFLVWMLSVFIGLVVYRTDRPWLSLLDKGLLFNRFLKIKQNSKEIYSYSIIPRLSGGCIAK